MQKHNGYRHELKYYIGEGQYNLLSARLSTTMDRDRFCRRSGEYHIRSLYFDDYENGALVDKLSGVQSRDKYRIRIYNLTDKTIKLECKHKDDLYIKKQSLSLTRQECDALLAGDFLFLLHRDEPFAKQMYAAFRTRQLKPRVLVDYVREAYVFPVEDVRVTFDKNIRTAMRSTDLFNPHVPTYPALTEGYDMVMEVKFNRFLPAYIRYLIQPDKAQRSAVSKYCLARQFEF